MKTRVMMTIAAGLVLAWLSVAQAEQIQLEQPEGGVSTWGGVGDRAKTSTTLDAALAGEDVAADVQKTEERYLTIPIGGTDAMIAADQLYKSNAGYVKGISCSSDATATAGTIALRDSAVAGAGNILWSQDILAIAYTPGMIREDIQTPFSVGLFLDFTTTADVKCMVRFR